MANTIASALVIDTLADKVITTLGNQLAPFNAFSRDYSTDILRQGANVQVKKATAGATVQTNPTSFETGNSTMTNVNVLVSQYSVSFTLTSQELNQGFRIENIAGINAIQMANKLIDVAFAPVTTTNFASVGTLAEASFSNANTAALWAAVAKSPVRNLILSATAYSKLQPVNLFGFTPGKGAYGFDGIFLNTRWNGAGTNVYCAALGQEAIATASGLPYVDPAVSNLMLEQRTLIIDGIGLPVQMSLWGSLASRSLWCSLDVMFGAALGDNTAGATMISA